MIKAITLGDQKADCAWSFRVDDDPFPMKVMMSRFFEVIVGRDADETSVRFDRGGGVPGRVMM
jgi:hypothetical protein